MLGFANGMSASLLCCSLIPRVGYRLAVFGTKGCAELATAAVRIPVHAGDPAAMPTGRHTAARARNHRLQAGSMRSLPNSKAFAAAIRGERPYPITAEEVLHGVAAFEAIVRSAATHQPVKVAPADSTGEEPRRCRSPWSRLAGTRKRQIPARRQASSETEIF